MNVFRLLSYLRRLAPKQSDRESVELRELRELDDFLSSFMGADHFVARSEYDAGYRDREPLVCWFQVLSESGMLEQYCRKHGTRASEAERILARYADFRRMVDRENEAYLVREMEREKDYLDGILRECDPQIRLDEDQRRVVLTDEDYCLVVAGAGAGKTTTVAARVKYLVEKREVDPKQILVISFTNKAVNELRERITGELHIPCPIATFHSTGNAVLRIHDPEPLNIVEPSKLYYVVQDYLRGTILQDEAAVNSLILFFATYFDAPYEGKSLNDFFNHISKLSYSTMRSELDEFCREVTDSRTRKKVTIRNEVLRSGDEVEIANFLYLNGLDYDYEPLYPYRLPGSRKPYTPDFVIRQGELLVYLEHFGISEEGKNDRYPEEQLKAYRKAVNDKVLLHRQHGTKLLYTFSSFRDGRTLEEHLREQLLLAGFSLEPRSNREIMEKLVAAEGNRYIRKLVVLICRFITNFKTNGYTAETFASMARSTANVRSRLFLNVCRACYLEYERVLKENHAVDFQDMINESARVLREVKEMKRRLDFRYIIVDEYQDISRQRFDLVTALSEVTDAKIMAVGDDWQSIYAFSGSDITLFTKFAEKMGYAQLLKITRTYRNAQEVIDIAGNFIQNNAEQIPKALVSPKHLDDPVIIYTYDSRYKNPKGDRRSGTNYAMACAVETALTQIRTYNREEGRPEDSSVLLLGRFGFDGDMLSRSGLFEYSRRDSMLHSLKYPGMEITFMTAHSSKGLGYDNVILINGKNETYGFPSKIEDDPVLQFVTRRDDAVDYAEERRLFYVALTRTKNRVFCIAPEQNPSEFLLEIKKDYRNVVLWGEWNEDPAAPPFDRKVCPVCGYPMQLRYKIAYGLRLYICTNEPEACSFMTTDIKAGKLPVLKCDRCRDGYLIPKPVKMRGGRGGRTAGSRSDIPAGVREGGAGGLGDGALAAEKPVRYILGCTNYLPNGKGCMRVISREELLL